MTKTTTKENTMNPNNNKQKWHSLIGASLILTGGLANVVVGGNPENIPNSLKKTQAGAAMSKCDSIEKETFTCPSVTSTSFPVPNPSGSPTHLLTCIFATIPGSKDTGTAILQMYTESDDPRRPPYTTTEAQCPSGSCFEWIPPLNSSGTENIQQGSWRNCGDVKHGTNKCTKYINAIVGETCLPPIGY